MPQQVACERAAARAWQESYRARVYEEGRRNELAIAGYEKIAGAGSWQRNDMTAIFFDFGGRSLLDDMSDVDIVTWVEDLARFDLELEQEIAREAAEAEER